MTELQLSMIASVLTMFSTMALIAALYYDKIETLINSIVGLLVVIGMIRVCYLLWLFMLKTFVV